VTHHELASGSIDGAVIQMAERAVADRGLKGVVTDAALAEVRARIGTEIVIRSRPHLDEATRDTIRHWADGIGDLDPKWRDPEYAAGTRFGGIVAPPSMLYAFDIRAIGDRSGLPGVHSFFGGADHEWYLPIRRNDAISLRVVLSDLVEKPSKFAGRMFQQISECTFTNQDGDVVARSWPWGMRTERGESRSRDKYAEMSLAHYTPEQIADISEQYRHEHELIRGADTRYWEDVAVGDRLGPMIRGPWTSSVAITFLHGQGGMFLRSHAAWYDYVRRHPKAGIINEMGIPEGPSRGHWDNEFARKLGVPAAYDFGPERIGWLTTLCTYWCGDEGWLERMRTEVRQFNVVGDLTTLEGVVTGRSVVGDHGIVEADIWARDQRGADSATATVRIRLPLRAGAPTTR
jgi:acyl dehydratase